MGVWDKKERGLEARKDWAGESWRRTRRKSALLDRIDRRVVEVSIFAGEGPEGLKDGKLG